MLCECISHECFEEVKMPVKKARKYRRSGLYIIKAGHPIPKGTKLVKGFHGVDFYRLNGETL